MPPRGTHPRVVVAACQCYALLLWLYPPDLRRAFRRELLVTFKNQAEDAFETGRLAPVMRFVVNIGGDWLRTCALESEDRPLSLLGLEAGAYQAGRCVDRSTFSGSLLLAMLGVALLIAGWYEWLALMETVLRAHGTR